MKIIVYNGKDCDFYLDASTPDKEHIALYSLFEYLDELGCYDDITNKDELDLYNDAKKGLNKAVRSLLNWHKDYEYEGWNFDEVVKTIE